MSVPAYRCEVEKHYMTLDMESSTLGAEIEKITESITETGEFVPRQLHAGTSSWLFVNIGTERGDPGAG